MTQPHPWPQKYGRPMLPSELRALQKKQRERERQRKYRAHLAELRAATRVRKREQQKAQAREVDRTTGARLAVNIDEAGELMKDLGWATAIQGHEYV